MAGIAGCGSEPLPTATAPLAANTPVSAQTYLNDSAGAAAATREFARILGEAGADITRAEARAVAGRLRTEAERVAAIRQRLAAQRLEDTRLERQRSAVVGPLGDAERLMSQIATAAQAGDVAAVAGLSEDLATALAAVSRAARGA